MTREGVGGFPSLRARVTIHRRFGNNANEVNNEEVTVRKFAMLFCGLFVASTMPANAAHHSTHILDKYRNQAGKIKPLSGTGSRPSVDFCPTACEISVDVKILSDGRCELSIKPEYLILLGPDVDVTWKLKGTTGTEFDLVKGAIEYVGTPSPHSPASSSKTSVTQKHKNEKGKVSAHAYKVNAVKGRETCDIDPIIVNSG
jgi:hypothetical protein